MKSISIQGVDEQLSTVLRERATAARKSVSQFVLDTLRQHLGLEKPITDEAAPKQQLTGIVGELAGLLKDRDVDEVRGAYVGKVQMKRTKVFLDADVILDLLTQRGVRLKVRFSQLSGA